VGWWSDFLRHNRRGMPPEDMKARDAVWLPWAPLSPRAGFAANSSARRRYPAGLAVFGDDAHSLLVPA